MYDLVSRAKKILAQIRESFLYNVRLLQGYFIHQQQFNQSYTTLGEKGLKRGREQNRRKGKTTLFAIRLVIN